MILRVSGRGAAEVEVFNQIPGRQPYRRRRMIAAQRQCSKQLREQQQANLPEESTNEAAGIGVSLFPCPTVQGPFGGKQHA